MFMIYKFWPDVPESAQPATQELFEDEATAERIMRGLQAACRGRIFYVKELD
jgi:hypothetical protein